MKFVLNKNKWPCTGHGTHFNVVSTILSEKTKLYHIFKSNDLIEIEKKLKLKDQFEIFEYENWDKGHN